MGGKAMHRLIPYRLLTGSGNEADVGQPIKSHLLTLVMHKCRMRGILATWTQLHPTFGRPTGSHCMPFAAQQEAYVGHVRPRPPRRPPLLHVSSPDTSILWSRCPRPVRYATWTLDSAAADGKPSSRSKAMSLCYPCFHKLHRVHGIRVQVCISAR